MARTIGFVHSGTKRSFERHFAAFARRLYEFVGEEDVGIDERWGGDAPSRTLVQHATDLIDADVDVLVAAGGPQSALAAREAAKGKVPVVFTSVTDPVGLGLVKSLDYPEGNMTGIAGLTSELDPTRLELLHEFLGRKPSTVSVFTNSKRPGVNKQYKTLAAAAPAKVTLVREDVADESEIKAAFARLKRSDKVDAVLVTADSLFNDLRRKVVGFAKGLPAIYQWREFAEAGGLMSYGPNIFDAYEQVAEYVSHILDGDKPADLPVSLPDRFELVINNRVAYAEGFKIPASLMLRAEFVHRRLRTRHAEALGAKAG